MNSDVCIITEGTFPYVMGGVSTWIAQIIESMPAIKFSVLNISPSRRTRREIRYDLPKNLVGIHDAFIFDSEVRGLANLENIQDLFLFDYASPRRGKEAINRRALSGEKQETLLNLYRALSTGQRVEMADISSLARGFESDVEFMETMAHSYSAWEAIRQIYSELGEKLSFLDFFWSIRARYMPIFNILRASLPKARVYHAACTGYAGFLGARASHETGRPLILTEHGIYSRERRIELMQADWLSSSGESRFFQLQRSRNWFRESWMALFQSLSLAAYENASKIISLYPGNRDIQISEGAPRDKVEIIPNGIITGAFRNIPRRLKSPGEPLRIGFVGRVVAIKDIKTLLRAMSILAAWETPFETSIVGPLDEEPEYVAECLELLEKLNLGGKVFFRGPSREMARAYAEMDVLTLTSASEGFPYVILEANCAGAPVVATEVGACRDMLTGFGKDDIALGPSGRITAVGKPEETAAALARFARNPGELYAYGQTGRERVARYYDQGKIMARYQDLYETCMSAAKKSGRVHAAKDARTIGTGVH